MGIATDYNFVMSAIQELGKRLLISRRNLKWNQDTLSGRTGISRTYISDIERDKAKSVSIDIVMALAQALGVSPSYLLGEAEIPNPEFPEILDYGSPVPQELSERLRLARLDSGLTQDEVAEQAGISAGYVSDIELGKVTNVSADILVALARALEVSIAFLLGETEYPLLELSEEEIREAGVSYIVTDPKEAEIIEMIQQMDDDQKQQMIWGARLLLSNNGKPRIIE